MMISGVSRTFSLSVYRLDVVATATAGSTASAPATITASPDDRVTLSPEATGSAGATSGGGAENPVAAPEPRPSSPASGRAEALFTALDADRDGAISEDEFTDGARRLLGRGHRHAHGHDRERERDADHGRVEGPSHGHYGRHGRLERRLERLFDRVDGNGDGSVDRDELTAALTRRDASPGDSETPVQDAPAAGVALAVGVTMVSVSITAARTQPA